MSNTRAPDHRPFSDYLGKRDAIAVGLAALAALACAGGGGPTPGPASATDSGTATMCSGVDQYAYGVASVSGTLNTGVHDISYSGGSAQVSLQHKRDVDPVENGCIGHAKIYASNGSGQCLLTLEFSAVVGQSQLKLTRGELKIDSSCLGWLDSEEGQYVWNGVETGELPPPPNIATDENSACISGSLAPSGTVHFAASNRPLLTVNLGAIHVTGPMFSYGQDTLVCPAP